MSGTVIPEGAIIFTRTYAMSWTDLQYDDLQYDAIGLHACYAMSGTDLQYDAIGLRACYAMS
eukprot:1111649-Rhodomonas_salina.1